MSLLFFTWSGSAGEANEVDQGALANEVDQGALADAVVGDDAGIQAHKQICYM